MATTLPITVEQPASIAIDFYATDPNNNNVPIDLTSVTEISVSVISNTPPTCVTVLKSTGGVVLVGSAVLGHFQAQFTSAQVLTMPLSTLNSDGTINEATLSAITVKITNPSNPNQNPYVIVVSGALAIFEAPC